MPASRRLVADDPSLDYLRAVYDARDICLDWPPFEDVMAHPIRRRILVELIARHGLIRRPRAPIIAPEVPAYLPPLPRNSSPVTKSLLSPVMNFQKSEGATTPSPLDQKRRASGEKDDE